MALTIKQKPRYNLVPSGNEIIFTVLDGDAVANKYRVKYICEVYVRNANWSVTNSQNRVASLKTTPNDAGVGMFDISPILDNFVSPDYTGGQVVHSGNGANYFSQYKGVDYTEPDTTHPIHLIDKYSTNRNSVRYFQLKFKVQYSDTQEGDVAIDTNQSQTSEKYLVYNGVLQETDVLLWYNGNYTHNLSYQGWMMRDTNDKFLTKSPATIYARSTDYGTLSFFTGLTPTNSGYTTGASGTTYYSISKIQMKFYDSSDVQLGSTRNQQNGITSGGGYGNLGASGYSAMRIQYFGAFPGNLQGAGYSWNSNTAYYTVQAFDDTTAISKLYTIKIIEDDCKGYETIRLAWLNTFGVWDYYTFTKKSTRTVTTKKVHYQQLKGTWNKESYNPQGYLGGNKVFTSGAKEMIEINTDYIDEDTAVWLQELFVSPDVYILNSYSTDNANEGYGLKYVEPVVLTTSSYTRKTLANDGLIQYKIDLERSKKVRVNRI